MKNLEELKKILDHIHENPASTQRELVKELNISLGKVNFLVKALAEKGIIKLKRFKNSKKKIGYLYVITPEGIKEKAQITREFLRRKLDEYNSMKEEIERLKNEMEVE